MVRLVLTTFGGLVPLSFTRLVLGCSITAQLALRAFEHLCSLAIVLQQRMSRNIQESNPKAWGPGIAKAPLLFCHDGLRTRALEQAGKNDDTVATQTLQKDASDGVCKHSGCSPKSAYVSTAGSLHCRTCHNGE